MKHKPAFWARRSVGISLMAATVLCGCVMAPKDSPRLALIPESQLGLQSAIVAAAPEGWWKAFGDDQLNALVEQALVGNPSLAEASARLRLALAQADTAHAGLFPKADALGTVQRARAPDDFVIPPPLAGHYLWTGVIGANLSWDLDFFGKQADAVAQAGALANAAGLDIANAHLLLAGALAQAYVSLYRDDLLAEIASQAEVQRQRILEITQRRVDAGLDTRLELREAQGALPQARIERMQASADAELAVHQLAMISGQGAEAYVGFKRPQLHLDAALALPAELPINLLARRPDVSAARLRVEAADAQRRAAKAAFYPDISLTALAGLGSFGLNNLVQAGAFGYGGGPMLTLPIFDAGKLKAQYHGSEAELDLAVNGYNQTVLSAVQQASDQLSLIRALGGERDEQKSAQDAAEDAYHIAEERYRSGLAGYLSVLTAESQVLSARRQAVELNCQLVEARITLLLALGGSLDAGASAAVTAPARFSASSVSSTTTSTQGSTTTP